MILNDNFIFFSVHIKLKLKDKVEGLLIQGNHAPFNLGFPFGQFDVTDEFQCSCDNLFAESVPCLTRPDMELIVSFNLFFQT